jgi:cytochrome P450
MPGAFPGVGHLPRFARDPLRFFVRLRDHADLAAWRLGPVRCVFVHRPADVQRVLLNVEKEFSMDAESGYAFGLFAGNGIIATAGPFWRRQRKMMQPGMRPNRIAGYATTMVELTEQLTRSWTSGQTRDLRVDMLALTQKIAAKTMFGVDVTGDAAAVGRALDVASREIGAEFRGVTMFLPGWLPTPGRSRLKSAIAQVEQVLYRIIDERTAAHPAHDRDGRAEPARPDGPGRPDDMLQLLMDARDEAGEPMSARQLRDETMTLYIAGHETTGNTLVWAYYLLSRHPEVFDRMVAEVDLVVGCRLPTMADYSLLKYTEAVVKETLRLYPPAWLLMVTASADVEIGGYRVPRGTQVWMSQWATHHDSRWFPGAEDFRPQRWIGDAAADIPRFAWFPFGGGPHVCLGNRFALVEAVLVLATIAQRYRIEVEPGLDLPPQPLLTLQPGRDVPARVTLRGGGPPSAEPMSQSLPSERTTP